MTLKIAIDELMNGLARYAGRVVIVLDDLHHVGSEDGLESLGYAVEHLPGTTRIIATTRSDPRLRLGRLRARGRLGELRARDLAFTPDEAQELLTQHGVAGLDRGDVELLVQRTEGWPAGLGLAGMWLAKAAEPREQLQEFSASHTHVADYLTTEVLDILAPEVRTFLLRSSVLGRFTAQLCDSVLQQDDSAAMLEALARSNLFLVPLDGRGEWYRYHHLFRELLQAELAMKEPGAPAELHRRAAEWFIANGLIQEGLEHTAALGDPAALAALLQEQQVQLIRGGHTDLFVRWLERVPDDELAGRPVLAAAGALASGLMAQPTTLRKRYAAVAENGKDSLPDAQRIYVETIVAMTRGGMLDLSVTESLNDAQKAADLAVSYVERPRSPSAGGTRPRCLPRRRRRARSEGR